MKRANTSSRRPKAKKKTSSSPRRPANAGSRTNPQYIFSQDAEHELRILHALESLALSQNSIASDEYRLIERLGEIREELHYIKVRLYCVDSIAGCRSYLEKIADHLGKPTLWGRLRLRLLNWRWRRWISRGGPKKDWTEKTREALAEWEGKANGEAKPKQPAKWESVWR